MLYRRNILRHIISLLISLLLVFTVSYLILRYPICHINGFTLLSFIGCFCAIPALLLMIVWHKKPFRWYLLPAILIVSVLSVGKLYYNWGTHDTNWQNYVYKESSFYSAARMFLPLEKDMQEVEEVVYQHAKRNNGTEYIYMTCSFQYSDYAEAIVQMERVLNDAVLELSGYPYYCINQKSFIMFGHTYRSCLLNIGGKTYAFAYSKCDDSNTMFYLFFTDENLAYMNMPEIIDFYFDKCLRSLT